MRKVFFLLIPALLGLSGLYGQDQLRKIKPVDPPEPTVCLGVKIGVNGGAPVGPVPEGATGKPGIGPTAAVFARIFLKDRLYLQPELEYSLKSATFHTPISGDTSTLREIPTGSGNFYPFPTYYNGAVDGKFANHYFVLPVMLNYRFSKRWYAQGGPWVGYLVHGDNSGLADIVIGNNYTTVTDEPFDQTEYLSDLDYGVALGTYYELESRFFASLRISYGLRSVYQNDYSQVDGTFRNIYAQLALGHRFKGF